MFSPATINVTECLFKVYNVTISAVFCTDQATDNERLKQKPPFKVALKSDIIFDMYDFAFFFINPWYAF